MWGAQQTCGGRCSGQMRPKFKFLAWMQNTMCGRKLHTAHDPEQTIPTMKPGGSSRCGDAFLQQGQGSWSELLGRWMETNSRKSWKKPCYSLLKTWDWGGVSPSSRTTSLNIQPEVQYNGLDQSIFVSEWGSQKSRPKSNWESLARLENYCSQTLSSQSD